MLIYFIIIIMIIYVIYYNYTTYENLNYTTYENFNISDMRDCNQCSYKSKIDCMVCNNCGYCMDEYGNGRCVSGDQSGPFFESCNLWNNSYNVIMDQPVDSYFTYQEPNYRRYYGNNQGRRRNHRVY